MATICNLCSRNPKARRHRRGCPMLFDARYTGIVLCMQFSWNYEGLPYEKDKCSCGKVYRHAPDIGVRRCLRCTIAGMFPSRPEADVRSAQEANIRLAAKGRF